MENGTVSKTFTTQMQMIIQQLITKNSWQKSRIQVTFYLKFPDLVLERTRLSKTSLVGFDKLKEV